MLKVAKYDQFKFRIYGSELGDKCKNSIFKVSGVLLCVRVVVIGVGAALMFCLVFVSTLEYIHAQYYCVVSVPPLEEKYMMATITARKLTKQSYVYGILENMGVTM